MSGFIGGLGLSAIPSTPPHPGIRSGTNYYISPTAAPSTGTSVALANTAYYQPFILPGIGVDRIGIETTAGAGNARLGIYSNTNGLPDQLILDAGILDVSGIAVNEISLASTAYLPNAWVWGCIIYSGTPTVRGGAAVANSYLIGVPTLSSGATRALIASQAYGALPQAATVAGITATTSAGLMFVRKT
jgi:hypothetical protein